MDSDKKNFIGSQLKEDMCSGDDSLRKTAGLAATEYFREEIRENSIYRQIIPPTTVTADNFDPDEESDFPSMLVEIAPRSSGAYKVSFQTNPKNAVIHGRKARVEFNRIMTDRYEIDKIRLLGYKMNIIDILHDLMLKDIMDAEDRLFTNANKNIVGWNADTDQMVANQADKIDEYGCRRALVVKEDLPTREGISKVKQGMLYLDKNIKPAKQLMSDILYSNLYVLNRNDLGGDMAQNIFVNGVDMEKINGVDTLITSKKEVVNDTDVWVFADPIYYGGFYTYEDVSMVLDEKDNIWLNFFAHEIIGGIIVNRAGVCVTRFDGDYGGTTDGMLWK